APRVLGAVRPRRRRCTMIRSLAVAALATLAVAPALAQKLPAAIGEEVPLANAVSGVPCKLRGAAASDNGSENWQVVCEGWDRPSIYLWRHPTARGGPDVTQKDSGWVKGLMAGAYLCEEPQPRKLLGDVEALVRNCKLRDGGWPAFILAARVNDKATGAVGLPDALPALETALTMMAGKPVRAAAGAGQGLQDYNVK